MTKSAKIRRLLNLKVKPKEIAEKLKVKPNLVYQVAWHAKKAKKKKPLKATFKSPRSKLIQAVFQANREVEAVKTKPLQLDLSGNFGIGTAVSGIDFVNSPPHYKTGGIEVLDFIEAKDLNYRLGNVVKYVSRAGKKLNADPVQDLEKAAFYLQREIEARKQA
jgi:hypothetical protein